ncbi:hypothetical protein [Novosphingobium humi]|uniref:Uncharacterized protein n=1 Tax=Novosphingobium humi TaxID=2282397 RepID=A0ABY7U442_9SPHN|nr:hypothetical protein [Novosphingobium humi]WCT80233.1 hypothetical protein PQ457_21850 [Novosphingobium humi]
MISIITYPPPLIALWHDLGFFILIAILVVLQKLRFGGGEAKMRRRGARMAGGQGKPLDDFEDFALAGMFAASGAVARGMFATRRFEAKRMRF